MSTEPQIKGSLEEQVEKSKNIICDVAAEVRTFRKSIPAGSLINEKRCGDEDMYLMQTIMNLETEVKRLGGDQKCVWTWRQAGKYILDGMISSSTCGLSSTLQDHCFEYCPNCGKKIKTVGLDEG